jgi:hypothetical protein
MTKKTRKYVVKPLGEGQVMQAYPLVQSAAPQLTMDQWLDYVQTLSRDGDSEPQYSGVMSVQNGDGYIYGIYCHEVEVNIQHGRVLKVSNFVAANLYDAKSVTDGLIDSMTSMARDYGCGAVHVDLPEEARSGPRPVDGIANQFKGAGYQVESVALCRSIKEK